MADARDNGVDVASLADLEKSSNPLDRSALKLVQPISQLVMLVPSLTFVNLS